MNFNDKVKTRLRLDTSDSEWDDGRRFVFKEKWAHILVGTEFGDYADVVWRSNTRKGEEAIKVVVWMELGEEAHPSGRTVQKYYDTNDLVKAFKWLAENTH